MTRNSSFSKKFIALSAFLCLFAAVTCFGEGKCPPNMVRVGSICIDKYESSAWSNPPDKNGNPQGVQFGLNDDDYPCSDNGNDCFKNMPGKIFAVSAPGVLPSTWITWFQAQQACANVGKRLMTNAEWQLAAAGTPDTGGADDGINTCNTDPWITGEKTPSGSRKDCISNWAIVDMVGNVWEWVADWMQDNQDHDGGHVSREYIDNLYGGDEVIGVDEANPEEDRFPAALTRGGDYGSIGGGNYAGVFAMLASESPSNSWKTMGFRCAQ
jgi:formylglycine-generating enzyme required for sulfatase activity